MQIEIISFTPNGQEKAKKIEEIVENYGVVRNNRGNNMEQPFKKWCAKAFAESQVLIFVGAAGIAVRAIAPFFKSKLTDPAVLVVDEKGAFVIPVLSGHMGGANDWARLLAQELGAAAVITTATDVNGIFAVDEFARKNRLTFTDTLWAKEISASLLRGEQVSFACEGNITGSYPPGIVSSISVEKRYQIKVGIHQWNHLYPKAIILGFGCKKGKKPEEIEAFILKQLSLQEIALESIAMLASIDIKKEESGICSFCEAYGLPFQVFSAEQLALTPGDYPESDFVKQTVGVGNVCERAAMCALSDEKGKLIMRKTAEQGMTIAIVEKEWSVSFE